MKIYRKISTFFRSYSPTDYWVKRGRVYQKEFVHSKEFQEEENVLIDYLKKLSFDTVLEFGCGFGRITKILLENFPIKKYVAFDLSPDQIINAKKLCKDFKNVNFHVSTIQDFKIDERFDLVMSIEVLLHVPPYDIEQIMNKLAGFSKHHIINADWYQEKSPLIRSPHNFLHNYEKIYKNIENVSSVQKLSINNKQSIFHAKIIT